MVAAVIAAGMTAGGAATAAASEPDDRDGPLSELTSQLSVDRVRDAIEVDRSSGEGGSAGLADLERALTEGAEPFVGSGEDSLLDPLNRLVCDLTADEFELLDLTPPEVELLGYCPAAPVVEEKDDDHFEDDDHYEDGYDDGHEDDGEAEPEEEWYGDDDSGTVPVGGIETGGGGTAGGGVPAAGVLGAGLALAAAGATLATRRLGRLG